MLHEKDAPFRANHDRDSIAADQLAGNQVGRTEESRHERRSRSCIDIVRPAGLEYPARHHHADAVGDGEGLFLVVRDQDRGDAGFALECAELGT